jgi:hypothetical protein
MRRALFLFLLASSIICMPALLKRCTHSFHLERFRVQAPLTQKDLPASDGVKQILAQEFTYLGRGSQAFVFASQDGQYVLKVLFFDSPKDRLLWRFFHCQDLGLLDRVEAKARKTFEACRLAERYMAEETGLVYLHLMPSSHLPEVSLKGPAWHRTTLRLDDMRWIIQRRVCPLKEALADVYRKKDHDRFSNLIQSILSVLSKRMEKGIYNTDPTLFGNFGVLGDRALEIDFGNYVYEPARLPTLEKERTLRQLVEWTEKHAPEWKKEALRTIREPV